MRYQWDSAKARANVRKHGINFADAIGVFEDPLAVTLDDPHPHEDRFLTLGQDLLGRVLVVHWTVREEDIRVISARRGTPTERRHYEEGLDHA
jgi:uncharacterized DUF497 family protein